MPLPLLLNEPGPLLIYLDRLVRQARNENRPQLERQVHECRAVIRDLLMSDAGAMLLDLLEKSTQLSLSPILGDERALAARNAQAFIPRDLRRIMSNETELLQQDAEASTRGARGRR